VVVASDSAVTHNWQGKQADKQWQRLHQLGGSTAGWAHSMLCTADTQGK
jgi:hypothetical protein